MMWGDGMEWGMGRMWLFWLLPIVGTVVLVLVLEAVLVRVRIGAREANVQAFNGSLPGPTLRVRPGDTLRVAMTNVLEALTNLHVHGLHVSPEGNGDNPFVSIGPGESFDDEYVLRYDHPPGTSWYHPHHHGHVADQLAAGLYRTIVVEDPAPVPVARERVLMISDLTLDGSGDLAEVTPMDRMRGREGETVLVNRRLRPSATAAPAATSPHDLLSLEVAGEPAGDLDPVPPGPSLRDLREEPVAARPTLDFAMGGMGGGGGPGRMMPFTIDGQEFDAERTDQRVRVGAVEEWTLANSSPMDHPVHLHVWPMQVVAEEGRDVSGPRWQDVVNVPAFGQVTVRVAFEDFGGRTVFHCHILDHEDLGMMGTLEAR